MIDRRDWEIRRDADNVILNNAMSSLLGYCAVQPTQRVTGALVVVLRRIAAALGLAPETINEPDNFFGVDFENLTQGSLRTYVAQICEHSRLGFRNIQLEDGWFNSDSGPLLAFSEAGQPCALMPVGDNSYIADFCDGTTPQLVDAKSTKAFSGQAIALYRLFPRTKIGLRDVFDFCRPFYSARNMTIFFIAMIAGSLLSSVTPVVSGLIFGDIVPATDASLLVVVACTLLLLALGGALVGIVRGFALSNIEINVDLAIHAAVIDRLFAMPESFFKSMTTGEILTRLTDINSIRSTLSNAAISILTAVFICLWNALLMFNYGGSLAWVVVISIVFYSLLLAGITWRQMLFYRQNLMLNSELSSKMLQIINGIAKLKVMRAEKRAFALWADVLAKRLNVDRQETNWGMISGVVLTLVQLISSMTIYWLISERTGTKEALPLPAFIAFLAAYGTFSASFSSIVGSLAGLLHIKPVYERITPLLQTFPEKTGVGKNISLQGGIRLDNVSFAYEDGKNVLEDISLEITPGQFVAIVGSSGCGKTTLLRLLLGFVNPVSGAVFYDNCEFSSLDVRSVRRQCGVVLQTGQLLPGSIFQNIVGVYNYTVSDAWEAAAAAGVANDIAQMPMQMHTMISEGATTISGGQRQRLLIARALIKKPRYIFFDEATSALDNLSQSIVMQSLEKLAATRLVIAHRLSTVRNADKIVVLDKGKIAECGTYEELVAKNGLFAKFARNQQA